MRDGVFKNIERDVSRPLFMLSSLPLLAQLKLHEVHAFGEASDEEEDDTGMFPRDGIFGTGRNLPAFTSTFTNRKGKPVTIKYKFRDVSASDDINTKNTCVLRANLTPEIRILLGQLNSGTDSKIDHFASKNQDLQPPFLRRLSSEHGRQRL